MRRFSQEHNGLIRAIFWAIVLVAVVLIPQNQSKNTNEAPIPTIQARVEPNIGKLTDLEPIEEPESMPRPLDTAPVAPEPRYGFTSDDIHLLSVLLSGSKDVSGDGEYDIDYGNQDRFDQISLVLCVVMNRVRDDRFPDTVSEVVWADGQFSLMYLWEDGLPEVSDITWERVNEWCEAYDNYDLGIQSVPEDHVFFSGDGEENHSRS